MVTSRGVRGRGQLVIQRIPDAREGVCTVLWDSGEQISLVTHQYAKDAGFGKRPASIQITGVGAGSKNESNVQYKALLRRRAGRPWMAEPEGTWPCRKSFSPAPVEEFRKDMLEGACCVIKEVAPQGGQEDDFPETKGEG